MENAIIIALESFAEFENETNRLIFLKEKFEDNPCLKKYYIFNPTDLAAALLERTRERTGEYYFKITTLSHIIFTALLKQGGGETATGKVSFLSDLMFYPLMYPVDFILLSLSMFQTGKDAIQRLISFSHECFDGSWFV